MTHAYITREGTRLHYQLEGSACAPSLVLLNSIGTDTRLWNQARHYLGERFQVLGVDARGHGGSAASDGDYTLDMLADDVAAAMDDAGIFAATIAGVSLGGMVAMNFALRYPQRCAALVPICTSATMDPAAWQMRVDMVREQGIQPLADLSMERFFSEEFRRDHPEEVRRTRIALLAMDPRGYAGCAAAIRDMALEGRLTDIACPTLVVTGKKDISTPFEGHGEHLVSVIPGARHLSLDCAHLAPMEQPTQLAAAISEFTMVKAA